MDNLIGIAEIFVCNDRSAIHSYNCTICYLSSNVFIVSSLCTWATW